MDHPVVAHDPYIVFGGPIDREQVRPWGEAVHDRENASVERKNVADPDDEHRLAARSPHIPKVPKVIVRTGNNLNEALPEVFAYNLHGSTAPPN